MTIVLAAAEFAPFAKTGGLADATSSLAKGLVNQGHEVICIMPKYGIIDTEEYTLNPTFLTLNVPMGMQTEYAHLLRYDGGPKKPTYYFIEHDMLFNRQGIYGEDSEYFDNDKRFIFLSRAVFEACKALDITPDIIHAHDHHAAFCMPFLKKEYVLEDRFHSTRGIFTIHNLAYQGKYNPYRAMDYSGFGMKEYYKGSWFEHYGTVNSMKVGIMFADKITTVSPTYANEIKMHYYGETLHEELNTRSSDLIGVLNGVDYDIWSPQSDTYLSKKYDADSLIDKDFARQKLIDLARFSDSEKPIIGMVTRLTEQKGIDLVMKKLDYQISKGAMNFALLGSGQPRFVDFFKLIKHKYPSQTFVVIDYNEELAHTIIAGSDYFLIPSRFEPCGLTQMYALKYGTVPIVRNTGGLSDTVTEYEVANGNGNGFVFHNYNAEDMEYAIERALALFGAKDHWNKIRINGMRGDNSFEKSASQYTKVYESAFVN